MYLGLMQQNNSLTGAVDSSGFILSNAPVMLPFKTLISIDRGSGTSLFLQICNALIKHISCGNIQPGHKLPGSRALADLLGVNRRTVTLAYEELEAQGWVAIRPNQGCFVSERLPLTEARSIDLEATAPQDQQAVFSISSNLDFLEYYEPPQLKGSAIIIDAGYPDIRISPLPQLGRHLSGITRSPQLSRLFNYSNRFNGDPRLQQAIINYLAETRSIQAKPEQLIITRGSLMAFTLIFQAMLQPGDKVVVGKPGFLVANNIIRIAGGELVHIEVDKQGLRVDQLENLCKKEAIKAVFIMPHHHNPTTVSLSAARRMKLLQLAAKYRFAIIEDDYDYDFHYANSPILPMASSDRVGTVIYVGSLSKTVAPGLRTGFIVAPADIIADLSRLSRFVDVDGNMALERAIAMLFEEGEIRRYLKKSLQIYRQRRDHFCALLRSELGSYVEFDDPEGGLAAWVRFAPDCDIAAIRQAALTKGLQLPKPVFSDISGKPFNAIRMGFASLDEEEMVLAMGVLRDLVEQNA
jgi:GntR family transcriptional regulator/MocR family aminotransferase